MRLRRPWYRWVAPALAALLAAAVPARRGETGRLEAGLARSGSGPTLDGVRRKGFVQCGVTTGVAGFSAPDARGEWRGLDVDVCRAVAAAVLGDAVRVRYTPLTAAQRFAALQSGEVDLLSRITTITFQRDVQLGLEFPAVDWYDGTGFIVHRSSGVRSARDLDGATICLPPGTTNELDVADYFRRNNLKFTPVVIERLEEATNAYFAGRCDAYAQDRATLAALRAHAPDPADHVVLPDVISKAPFGPAVRADDIRWLEVVRWSVYAMIDAEELGLTSGTIDRALAGGSDPDVQLFVGNTGGFGAMLGLDQRWAYNIVKQVGNYAESFDRNILPLGIDRGINRLWKDGGILYAPDLR
jgi:general L-amino acid transport system substrate-binding protein